MINISEKVVERLKTRILCLIRIFRKSCSLWDNVVIYCRARQATDDNIIRRMSFACRINKARIKTHTHINLIFNTYSFSMEIMLTWKRQSITLHLHCLSCLLLPLVRQLQYITSIKTWTLPPKFVLVFKSQPSRSWTLCFLRYWLVRSLILQANAFWEPLLFVDIIKHSLHIWSTRSKANTNRRKEGIYQSPWWDSNAGSHCPNGTRELR